MNKKKKTATEKKTVRPRGQQPIYSEKIAGHILRRLAEGDSLASICREGREADKNFPAASTVSGWHINDEPSGFAERYARAREAGVYAQLDRAHDELFTTTGKTYKDEGGNTRVDGGAVQLARAYADHIRWTASKMLPEEYGDKQRVEHSGSVGVSLAESIRAVRKGSGATPGEEKHEPPD